MNENENGADSENNLPNEQNMDDAKQQRTNVIKYLDSTRDSDHLKKSEQVLNSLRFLSNCFITKNDSEFNKLPEDEKITVINILISFIYMLKDHYKTNKTTIDQEQELTYEKIFDDIINTLLILCEKSEDFSIKFHEISEDSIKSITELLECYCSSTPKSKVKDNHVNVLKLFSVLIHVSKFCKKYENNWKHVEQTLENLKIELVSFDDHLDHKWLLFMINYNLKSNQNPLNLNFDFDSNGQNYNFKSTVGIAFLKTIDSSEVICKSNKLVEYLRFLNEIDESISQTIKPENQNFFMEFSARLLDQVHDEITLIINECLKDRNLEARFYSSLRRSFRLIALTSNLLRDLFTKSLKYSSIFHNSPKGLKVLFDYLKNDTILGYYTNTSDFILETCFISIIGCLHNLSRLQYKYLNKWNACDPVNICLKFLEKAGDKFDFHIYLVVVNIASDKQIETLPAIRSAINMLVEIIRSCVELLDNENVELKRMKIQVNENEEKEEMLFYYYQDLDWNIMELLVGLYRMCVNDKIKQEIYETYKMKNYLRTLILKGNNVEKAFSLKLLYQLSFDKEIANDIGKDKEFISYLSKLSLENQDNSKMLKKNCDGILWRINNSSDMELEACKVKSVNKESKHIMISYNGESRTICLQIKAELEKLGYKIWIDVENIAGSSLEAMAKAVEQSECVLMGMTEKYKMSPNCRLEAEYAIQLNKPVIPLILQEKYKPDGWLGIILGAKIFVNFKKYSFEECVRRLLIEIRKVYNDNDDTKNSENTNTSNQNSHGQTNTSNNSSNKIDWKEEDVLKWIEEKKFNKYIIDNIKPCNGKILYQMYSMLETVPEFFYTALRSDSNNRITLRDLAEFSFELKQLFGANI